jgi:hypothetical protein
MSILFSDDDSVLISHSNPIKFKNTINEVYVLLDDGFKKNSISLNTIKTYYINFTAKCKVERDIGALGAIITSANCTRFLGLTIEYSITWERHIDEVIKKPCTACYMLRNIKPVVSTNTLQSIYHSYFHSVMTYRLMFWGNSSHAERVFKLQKRVIRLIKDCGYRDSCREHFRDMNILPLKKEVKLSP